MVLFSFFFLAFHCSSQEKSDTKIQFPKTEIRLEFRGALLFIPEEVMPPYEFRARAYSCPEWDNPYAPRIALEEYPVCMKTYVEKIQSFETPFYNIDLDVPEDWSHAYIEFMGAGSVKGRFSPGHNPN